MKKSCIQCGKKIDGDSVFCPFCGTSQTSSQTSQSQPTYHPAGQTTQTENTHSGLKTFLIFLLIAAIIIGAFFLIFSIANKTETSSGSQTSESGGTSIFERNARNSDISVTLLSELSLDSNFEIKALNDIDNLEITFTFSDSDHDTLASITKDVGDVKSGNDYRVVVSLSDIGFITALSVRYYSWSVSGGTVSYI